jgi:hypothetical protein
VVTPSPVEGDAVNVNDMVGLFQNAIAVCVHGTLRHLRVKCKRKLDPNVFGAWLIFWIEVWKEISGATISVCRTGRSDRVPVEEEDQLNNKYHYHHQLQHEGAALVEFVDHEAVELFGGLQFLLD